MDTSESSFEEVTVLEDISLQIDPSESSLEVSWLEEASRCLLQFPENITNGLGEMGLTRSNLMAALNAGQTTVQGGMNKDELCELAEIVGGDRWVKYCKRNTKCRATAVKFLRKRLPCMLSATVRSSDAVFSFRVNSVMTTIIQYINHNFWKIFDNCRGQLTLKLFEEVIETNETNNKTRLIRLMVSKTRLIRLMVNYIVRTMSESERKLYNHCCENDILEQLPLLCEKDPIGALELLTGLPPDIEDREFTVRDSRILRDGDNSGVVLMYDPFASPKIHRIDIDKRSLTASIPGMYDMFDDIVVGHIRAEYNRKLMSLILQRPEIGLSKYLQGLSLSSKNYSHMQYSAIAILYSARVYKAIYGENIEIPGSILNRMRNVSKSRCSGRAAKDLYRAARTPFDPLHYPLVTYKHVPELNSEFEIPADTDMDVAIETLQIETLKFIKKVFASHNKKPASQMNIAAISWLPYFKLKRLKDCILVNCDMYSMRYEPRDNHMLYSLVDPQWDRMRTIINSGLVPDMIAYLKECI